MYDASPDVEGGFLEQVSANSTAGLTRSARAVASDVMTPTTKETELADESLGAGLRERDKRVLEGVLEAHGAEIQAVAYLILRNEHDAEETLADTLLTVWRKGSTLRDPTRLRPWLLTTAARLALRRRRGFRPRVVSLDMARDVADHDRSPVDRLALQEAINDLPPRMRAVVALHDVADLALADVAAAVGRSENTVKSQLREARSRLRRALGDEALTAADNKDAEA